MIANRWYFGAFALSISFAIIFYVFIFSSPKQMGLFFPSDHSLTVHVNCQLHSPVPYRLSFSLKGNAKPLKNMMQYRLHCSRLSCINGAKQELFAYRREENTLIDGTLQLQHLYGTSPILSPETRHTLYKTLNIDNTTTIAEDGSVLQEEITIVVDNYGSIRELLLGVGLRNALFHSLGRSEAGIFLREILDKVEKLPPLITKEKNTDSQWETKGYLFEPIRAIHHVVEPGQIHSELVQDYFPYHTTLHQKRISENRWEIDWKVDETQRLTLVTIKGAVESRNKLLGTIQEHRYGMTINLEFCYTPLYQKEESSKAHPKKYLSNT